MSKIETKVAKSVGIISRLRHCLPPTALLNLLYATVYPHLLYCVILRSRPTAFKTHIHTLQTLQNRAVGLRVISRSGFRDHVAPHHRQLKILENNEVEKMKTVKLVHKCVNKSLPDCFHSFFSHVSKAHDHCTRSLKHDDLVIPYYRAKRAQKSIKYRGSKLWNLIPPEIKKLNLNQFSRQFRNDLLAKY